MTFPPGHADRRGAGEGGELQDATRQGRIVALTVACQRDLNRCADDYPDLFAAKPFDSTLFGAVASANTFGAPWATAEGLRIANRTALWIFGVDWLIDHVATSEAAVEDIVRRCLAVADGGPPDTGDDLTRFLADIRDTLAAVTAFSTLRSEWQAELQRMLIAMAREWKWKSNRSAGGAAPNFEEYLDNADNFGSSWVNVSHWIFTGDQSTFDHFEQLRFTGREVQRVLRLLNDLATYERDVDWGDMNALMLDVDRDGVTARIADLIDCCLGLIRSLEGSCPQQAAYLERQIGYSAGFYAAADYWGSR
ncbi:MAG: terpene synthase family protein [Actinomadura sp.]